MAGRLPRRTFMWATGVIDRSVGWQNLPKPLAQLTLGGIRMTLRRTNLFDVTGVRFPWGPSKPPMRSRPLTRSADGSGNNLDYPDMGRAGAPFGRNVPLKNTYPHNVLLPNPRTVSLELLTRHQFQPATSLNVLAAAWLQFQIHDWLSHGSTDKSRPWEIPLAPDDPWPNPPMLIPRTPQATPRIAGLPPIYQNTETHWWDGSQLYGSSIELQHTLRTHEGGKMLLTREGLVPHNPSSGQDLAGVTGNWWIGLAMMHTLFLREHNAICDMLAAEYPQWPDDQLFEHARLINVALMAKIQTLDFSTAVVANPTMRSLLLANWWGFAGERLTKRFGRISSRDEVNGVPGSPTDLFGVPYALTEEFVAIYRMHPLLPDDYTFRAAKDDELIGQRTFPEVAFRHARQVLDTVSLADLFYSLGTSHPGAIGLHNLSRHLQNLELPDGRVIDLGTTEIVRDRERGVPRYNQFRRFFHLRPAASFEHFSDDPGVAADLRRIYDDPESVDLMVGLYAEDPPPGFAFSNTAFRVFVLMATRRLKSDRFFTYDYRPEVYTPEGLKWIGDNTLKSVILRHCPELSQPLNGIENAFLPWRAASPRQRRRPSSIRIDHEKVG